MQLNVVMDDTIINSIHARPRQKDTFKLNFRYFESIWFSSPARLFRINRIISLCAMPCVWLTRTSMHLAIVSMWHSCTSGHCATLQTKNWNVFIYFDRKKSCIEFFSVLNSCGAGAQMLTHWLGQLQTMVIDSLRVWRMCIRRKDPCWWGLWWWPRCQASE